MLAKRVSGYFLFFGQWCAIAVAFAIPISTTLTQVFFLAAVFFVLCAGQWRKQYETIVQNRIALLLLAFFCLFLLGLTYTTVPFSNALNMVIKYHRYLLALFLFYLFNDEKIRRYALYAFMLAVAITLVLSYVKFFTGVTWFNSTIPPTDPAVFKNHIETGFLLAIGGYFYALFAISDPRRRWFWALLCLLTVVNLFYFNQGRSGYVVFVALALLLGWQFLRWRGLFAAFLLSVVLIGSAAIVSSGFKMRLEAAKQDTVQFNQGEVDTSLGLRAEFVKNSLKLIKAHPFFGTGTGSFAIEYKKVYQGRGYATSNPHNEYLNMLVQFGALGLVMLLVLFYFQWRDSYRLSRDMQCIAQAVVVVIAVGSLANSWLMDITEGYFYVYFTALAFSSLRIKGAVSRL